MYHFKILVKNNAAAIFTWADRFNSGRGKPRLHCPTVHQCLFRAVTSRVKAPHRQKFSRVLYFTGFKSGATVELSAQHSRLLQTPRVPGAHRSPLFLILHLQSTSTAAASVHQPHIIVLCNEIISHKLCTIHRHPWEVESTEGNECWPASKCWLTVDFILILPPCY